MAKKKTSQPINPLLFILPFSLLGVVIAVLIVSGTNTSTNSFVLSKEQVIEGKRLYELKCASCHGLNGEGQYPNAPNNPDANGLIGAPPHNSTGHTWHHADTLLVNQIKNGSNVQGFHPMPAFSTELNDEQVALVLGYIKIWWTRDQLAAQATVTAKQQR